MTVKKQRMAKAPFVFFLALISSGAPIATDLYLPALPDMPQALGQPISIVNLTLTAYFFAQAIGMLLFGPLSDRYGRKRPVGMGILFYIAGSLLCAFSNSVWTIIAARALQGFGGGGMVSLATALVKDCFEGRDRQNALVAIQAIGSLAPLIAPVAGSALLMVTDWRGTFVAQSLIGICSLPFFARLQETVPSEERATGSICCAFRGFGGILKDAPLTALLVGAGLTSTIMMAYITSASYVYVDFFGLTKMQYSLFFALNAAMGTVGALLIPVALKRTTPKRLLSIIFTVIPLASVLHLFVASASPFVFVFCTILIVPLAMATRPVAVNILMGMHEGDTGTLSSLINFAFAMMGCAGSLLTSLPWPSYVMAVGGIALGASLITLIIWLFVKKEQRVN